MMNRNGRARSMEVSKRDMFRRVAELLEVEIEDSGGANSPSSRKVLIFDMRRRDEADGDSRIMGSGRREGAARGFVIAFAGLPWVDGCFSLRGLKTDAILRTCEKSLLKPVSSMRSLRSPKVAYGRLDSSENTVPVSHAPLSIVDLSQSRINRFPWPSSITRHRYNSTGLT